MSPESGGGLLYSIITATNTALCPCFEVRAGRLLQGLCASPCSVSLAWIRGRPGSMTGGCMAPRSAQKPWPGVPGLGPLVSRGRVAFKAQQRGSSLDSRAHISAWNELLLGTGTVL